MKFAAWSVILAAVLAISPLPVAAQNPVITGGDFRGAHWGQSPAEIERLEAQAPFRRDEEMLIFHGEVDQTPTEVIYFFVADRLVMGFTHLLADPENLDDYFDIYDRVKGLMAGSLGAPAAENWQMSLPDLQEDRSMWAEALGFGLIKVEAGWLTRDTGVALRLSGENFKGHLMTVYFSREDMNAGRLAYRDYFARNMGVPNRYFQN